jgi:dTDP-4-dehydrorhamnose 3,5-epimerase
VGEENNSVGREKARMLADLGVSPVQDDSIVDSDWNPVATAAIHGVQVRSIRSVITDNGFLTEIWRADWALDLGGATQIFQRVLSANSLSAWHVHLRTTDRLFCGAGEMLLVLFDARRSSPTYQAVAEYRFGEHRPSVVSIPPGVVHGVKALGDAAATLINTVDNAYCYEQPDHYRLPPDSLEVPYKF